MGGEVEEEEEREEVPMIVPEVPPPQQILRRRRGLAALDVDFPGLDLQTAVIAFWDTNGNVEEAAHNIASGLHGRNGGQLWVDHGSLPP